MKRETAIALLVMLTVALSNIAPVAAHPADVGLFQGTATVGKAGLCNQDGGAAISGAGLGLPIINGVKQAYWALETTVQSLELGAVTLAACGYLDPIELHVANNNLPAVGASCGASKSHGGRGRIGDHYRFDRFTSKSTAAGTQAYYGVLVDNGDVGNIFAVVQAQGGAACLTKSGTDGSKTGGATAFQVVGVYGLSVHGHDKVKQQERRGICKDSDPDCNWRPKNR